MIVIDQTDRDNIVRGYFEQENIDPTRQNELRNQIEEILLELQSLARETLITSNLAPELINWAQKLRAIEQEFEQAETDDNDPFLLGERKDRAEEEIERLLRTDPELTNDLYKILQPEEDLETWYFKDYLKIFTNRAIRKCDFNPEQVVALLEELLEYFSNHDHEQEYDFGQIKNKLLNNKRIVSSGEYMSVSYSLDSLMKFFSKWIDQGLFKPNTEKFITACREIIDELKTPLLPDPEQATGI